MTPTTESAVLETLESAGAQDIERASGAWRDGHWVDVKPTEPPKLDES